MITGTAAGGRSLLANIEILIIEILICSIGGTPFTSISKPEVKLFGETVQSKWQDFVPGSKSNDSDQKAEVAVMRLGTTHSLLIVALATSSVTMASEAWLPESKGFSGAHEVSPALYIDLRDDREAVEMLAKSVFVTDEPALARSESLICPDSYKKYLIRSISLGTSMTTVYQEPHRLIIGTGSFGSPREPDRSAIAICLLADPEVIEGSTSFLK